MKKNALVALCYMVMIGLSGCQQAEEIKSSNEELRMSIEASIGKDGTVAGRTVMGDDGKSVSFANGDMIGLFVNTRSVVKWTYDKEKDKWGADGDVYWDNKVDGHDFCAFYPYKDEYDDEIALDNVPMPDLTEQDGDIDDLKILDFLVAKKTQGYNGNGIVSFSGVNAFEHVFSLIAITLQGEGDLVGSTIEEITIEGENIVTPYAYSFVSSQVVPMSDDGDNGVDELEFMTNCTLGSEGYTFYFVVNTGASLKDVDLSIRYIKGENEYVATLEGMNDDNTDKSFERGKQYSYSLKVMDGVLSISGNTIKNWEEGVTMGDIIINRQEESTTPES